MDPAPALDHYLHLQHYFLHGNISTRCSKHNRILLFDRESRRLTKQSSSKVVLLLAMGCSHSTDLRQQLQTEDHRCVSMRMAEKADSIRVLKKQALRHSLRTGEPLKGFRPAGSHPLLLRETSGHTSASCSSSS